jgi:chaperonin GroES
MYGESGTFIETVPLPVNTPGDDPRIPTLDDADIAYEEAYAEPSAADKLMALASTTGNFAAALDPQDLARIGAECVEGYERDKKDRSEWETIARTALESAKQKKKSGPKNSPWKDAANIRFPLLTPAVLQFWARMLPAVIKGDEAILCKVIGQDNGRPVMMQDPSTGQMMPVPMMAPGPDGQPAPVMGPDGQPQPMWQVQPGAKAKKARRVSEYLNTVLFYRMEDWEADTSSLLMQLPTVGCVFRKYWYDAQCGEQRSAMVSALRIFLPKGARSEATTPRLTEEVPDVYPHEISESIRSGQYLDVDLYGRPKEGEPSKPTPGDDGPRLLLEQHRLIDLDEDGFEEPYIVTVDHETMRVLRIEANYGPDDVKLNDAGEVMSIKRGRFYVKHGLFPDPEGGYYDLGLGHLLDQCGAVVDTAMNQLLDAGTAQTAGGGFIGSGVRLQARGGGSVVRMEPGVYKTVDVPGNELRAAIVERTLPNVSPVTFQVLDLILGVARDISGAKDVITGEASNNGQVGTTLALIEQGLQVFNATAKCIFRSLKEEYTLLKDNIRKYGGDAAAQDYLEVLDDPDADFEADFNTRDMDIRPVSDPSSVTRMQKMAKGQFVMSTIEQLMQVGGDPREALRRAYEAADIEDIDKLLPPRQPQQPNPVEVARAEKDMSTANLNNSKAKSTDAQAQIDQARLGIEAFQTGANVGAMA